MLGASVNRELAAPLVDPVLRRLRTSFLDFALRERTFIIVLGLCVLAAGLTYQTPHVAAWVGFLFASYSAIANDSIQTIGTFIAANRRQRWWILWLFMGGIFLATVSYSWVTYSGDVSYQRLAAKGFETSPSSFSFLQIAAPLFLLLLTRLRMPVSTTFLLLTSFATSAGSVGAVVSKSLMGYVLAFGVAFATWFFLSGTFARLWRGRAHPVWYVAQWVTSGALWSVWLMQDAANIAVYLPRQLGALEFFGFAGVIFVGLGLLFYMGGERVQEVVEEKSDVVDVRAATLIVLVYAFILYFFKEVSRVPMSTTWVFIGLLGGREMAMALRRASGRSWREAGRLMTRDLIYVTIGLLISLVIALAVNTPFRVQLMHALGLR
jgi:hypothetical protein